MKPAPASEPSAPPGPSAGCNREVIPELGAPGHLERSRTWEAGTGERFRQELAACPGQVALPACHLDWLQIHNRGDSPLGRS
jgi:hypothetical protein